MRHSRSAKIMQQSCSQFIAVLNFYLAHNWVVSEHPQWLGKVCYSTRMSIATFCLVCEVIVWFMSGCFGCASWYFSHRFHFYTILLMPLLILGQNTEALALLMALMTWVYHLPNYHGGITMFSFEYQVMIYPFVVAVGHGFFLALLDIC